MTTRLSATLISLYCSFWFCMLSTFCYENDDNGKAICGLDLDEGTCEDFTEQFFYNSTSKACETFFYGGCDGNENRFLSEKECSETCGDKGEHLICVEVFR